MRIVLISSAPPPALGLSQILASMGHQLPALIAFRGPEGRYGPGFPFALHEAAPEADLLFARTGKHLAGLLRACMTSDYDAGPIYAQGSVPIADDEDPATDGIPKFAQLTARLVT